MENIFRYKGQRLHADVSADMLPKTVSMVKSYLASRLYSEEEKKEDPTDLMTRTLKSMPDGLARKVNLNMLFMKRQMTMEAHERAAAEIADIPEGKSYYGAINITRGYRAGGNVAELKITTNKEGRANLELYFNSHCGDETRPLMWMQYDVLFKKAASEGFDVDRGTMNQEIEDFKEDLSTYFRTGPIDEVMSAFDWSELESVVNFLWPEELPEDIKRKLGK